MNFKISNSMKKLLFSLLMLLILPAVSRGQAYVETFSAQHQFNTQYAQAEMKYAFENYKGSVKSWQKKFRSELADLLGISRLQEQYKNFVPKAKQIDSEDIGFATRERWHIWTEPTMIIPVVIIRPKGIEGPMPLCITPQGHNANPEAYSGIALDEKELKSFETRHGNIAYRIAQKGIITINPTTRGFGLTRHEDDIAAGKRSSCKYYHQRDIIAGRVIVGDRVWDVMKIIDWALVNLPVDKDRIIVSGNSGGGTVSVYAGAIDERIDLCAPSSCFCSYEGSIGSIYHCYCNYVTNIMSLCNMGDLAGLVAPRKLLIINGAKDDIFPIGPAREEFMTTKAVYKAMGVADNCEMYEGAGGHRYYIEGFYGFWDRHFCK